MALDAATQDIALSELESGEVALPPELRDFFDLLVQNTKEGFLLIQGTAAIPEWSAGSM